VFVPALQPVFKTYDMSGNDWLLLIGLSVLVVPMVEIAKAVYRMVQQPVQLSDPAPSLRTPPSKPPPSKPAS
jgi:Ca2+-transporting ATPase